MQDKIVKPYRLFINKLLTTAIQVFLVMSLFSCSLMDENNAPVSSVKYTYYGVGFASVELQKGKTHQEKIINAIKVSKLHAYEELTEHLHGVLLNSQADINNLKLDKEKITGFTRGLVKGAKVRRTYHYGDVYITELELEVDSATLKQAASSNSHRVQGNQVYY